MKNFLKNFAKIIIFISSLSFIKIFFEKMKFLINYIYSGIISNSLSKSCTSHFFEFPVVIKGNKYIEIGENFNSRSRLRIEAWDKYLGTLFEPQITIGENVSINFDCHIGAINKVQIGNNVLIGSRVLITDHNHGNISEAELLIPPYLRPLYSKGPVIIEENVWIGEGVAILSGVRIGRNSIIGANAVVSFDVPDNCIVGGIPARVIKQF